MASLRCTKTALLSDPSCRSKDLAIETIELLLQNKYDETENRLGHGQALQLLKLSLSQDVLHVRRVNLRTGEGHTNGFADFGIHRRGGPETVRVAGLPTPQTEVLGPVLTFKEHLNAVFPDIQFTMDKATTSEKPEDSSEQE
ncbi:hypothetical protein SprV_0501774800 [Sparganum proliferum]